MHKKRIESAGCARAIRKGDAPLLAALSVKWEAS